MAYGGRLLGLHHRVHALNGEGAIFFVAIATKFVAAFQG
jgi:hypothetical protein